LVQEKAYGLDTQQSSINAAVPSYLRGDNLGGAKVASLMFSGSNKQEFKRAIATIIYHIVKYRAIAIIRENNNHGNLVLALSQLGVLDIDYITTPWSRNPFTLTLGVQEATYDQFKRRFEGIWNPEVIFPICAFLGSNGGRNQRNSFEHLYLSLFRSLSGSIYSNLELLPI